MTVDAYILCTSPRSGSTMLCRMLTQTGVAGRPGSYFHEPSLDAWCNDHDLPLHSGDGEERETLARVFEAAMETGKAGTDIFGLRLQRRSAPFFLDQLAILHPGHPNDHARLRAAFGETVFIYLKRQDTLAQAISFEMARQSGLWHRAEDGSELERLSAHREPVYDEARLTQRIEEAARLDEEWETWFAAQRIEPQRLAYEELATAPTDAVARTLKAMGLDDRHADRVRPDTAILANETSRDWARRYEGRKALS